MNAKRISNDRVACIELPLPELNSRQIPAFEYRAHNYYESEAYSHFATKLRLNGGLRKHNARNTGGFMGYARFEHTLGELVPLEVYGEKHPEYYSMRSDGSRNLTPNQNQLCLTNPDVLRIAVEVCNRVYIWDYTTSFSHYAAPHLNWRALQPNITALCAQQRKGRV